MNLLLSPDAEGPVGVPSFGKDRCLACELLQHLGCRGQPVSALPNTDIEAKLADLKFDFKELKVAVLFLTKINTVVILYTMDNPSLQVRCLNKLGTIFFLKYGLLSVFGDQLKFKFC